MLCVPFFASTGQVCPTHWGHRTHAARPSRGTLLIAKGIGSAAQPSRLAASVNGCPHAIVGEGRHRQVASAWSAVLAAELESPDTPRSHFDLLVVGLELAIIERPVRQHAVLRDAVRGRHAEVFREEAPGHALPDAGTSTQGHRHEAVVVGSGAIPAEQTLSSRPTARRTRGLPRPGPAITSKSSDRLPCRWLSRSSASRNGRERSISRTLRPRSARRAAATPPPAPPPITTTS